MNKNYFYKGLLFFGVFFCLLTVVQAQVPEYTYGNGQGANVFPLNDNTNNKVQWLYKVSEFNGLAPIEGMITAVYIKRSGNTSNNSTFQELNIKIGSIPVTMTQFANSTFLVSEMHQVFHASTHVIPSGSADVWIKFDLDQPYYYDGISNLVVEMSQQGYSNGFSVRNVTNGTAGQRIYGSWQNASGSVASGPAELGLDILPVYSADYDLAVTTINLLSEFCHNSVTEAELTIENMGELQITDFKVAWSKNGVFQNEWVFSELIDTINGINPSNVNVTLTNLDFDEGINNLKFWVFNPNGQMDEVNYNDTLVMTLNSKIYYDEVSVVLCPGDVLDIEGHIFDHEVVDEILVLSAVDGCDSIVSVSVAYHSGIPTFDWENEVLQSCEGEIVEIDASNSLAESYLWSNSGLSSSIYVTQSGTYSVDITYNDGQCHKVASTEIVFNPVPEVGLIEDTIVCEGKSLYLDAGSEGVVSYLWSTGATSQFIEVSETGYYQVQVENIYGCTHSDAVQVDFYPEPTFYQWAYQSFGNYKYQFALEGVENTLNYLWDFGDGNTSTVPMPIHQYQGPGVYTVFVYLEGLCTTNEFYKIFEFPVSIQESSFENTWTVYPNPAQEMINIKTNFKEKVFEIRVIDVLGREVYGEVLTNDREEYTIDLKGWSSGQYFIILTTELGTIQKSFVVQ